MGASQIFTVGEEKWKSSFKKHFVNRNARPGKITEDDDPSLEEFRVRSKLGSRSCGKNELIDRAVARLAQMFSEDVTLRQEAGAAADAEASAPDHDVAVLGARARSNASSPPDGGARAPEKLVEWVRAKFSPSEKKNGNLVSRNIL